MAFTLRLSEMEEEEVRKLQDKINIATAAGAIKYAITNYRARSESIVNQALRIAELERELAKYKEVIELQKKYNRIMEEL